MKEAVSSGGIVIYHGKILLLYMSYHNRYDGWVLPKGTVEPGEELQETAIREVKEETGANAEALEYLGACNYEFRAEDDTVKKTVHWYLMKGESYFSRPQKEEYFVDSGFYKFHEAYHLLKYDNEKNMLDKAYKIYQNLKRNGEWNEKK